MDVFVRRLHGLRIKKGSGFTLVELIAVIVILSIVASIGTGFVVKTTEGYQRTQARALLVNTSRQAIERMTRQLRVALPNSIRILNGGTCIEFMPIAAGGNYFLPVPDVANGASPTQNIPASPVVVDFGTPRHLTIGAMQPSEIYSATALSRAAYTGYVSGNLQLSASKRWERNSINRRYYLLDNPQAFCVINSDLRFYSNLGVIDTLSPPTGAFDILARDVTVAAPFSLQNSAENRNARINLSLTFAQNGETFTYTQGVLIRNVP